MPDNMEDLPKKDAMRRSPLFSQPNGTLQYTVKGNDTLNSIALHFESTPTQLMRLNHLSSRMLFPGQILYVPDPDSPEPICLSPSSTTKKTFDLPVVSQKSDIPKVTQSKTSTSAKRFLLLKSKSKEEKATSSKRGRKSLLRYQTEPRPGRVIRDRSQDDDAEESKNFLKLDVKYITDGEGVVSGTMLVTPNAIMFDPNVSDPLVKERGTSPYGVITQMDAVRGAAMYHDISAMNLKTKPESTEPGTCPVYVPENAKDGNKNSPTSQNQTSPTTDTKPGTEPNDKPSQPDSVLRTISNLSDGFVHVIDDVERSKETAGATQELNGCTSIPERDGDVEMDNLESEDCVKKEESELQKQADDTVTNNGEVGCESTEGALHNDLHASTTTGDAVAPHENDSNEDKIIIPEDSNQSQDIKDLSERELTNNDATHTGSTSIEACDDMESQDQVVSSDSKGSLPDLVESAEQSVKDKDSPTETDPLVSAAETTCPFCHGDMTSKMCSAEDASKLQARSTVEGTSPSNMPGFVNFSSGIFLRECKRCTAVPDITESVQDTSATERELEAIKAEGREIRRQSDLLSELPDADDEDSHPPPENEKAKTTKDVNKEVVLGYNKTNFEEYLPKPAQRYEDPPLYLCLRVGRPMSKTFPGGSCEGKGAGAKRNHKLPEYWFAIPREKADNLYAFFLQWSPDVYGKEGSPDDVGFVAVDDELESSLEVIEDFFEEPIGKDWEIITKEEANRRRMTILECEMNLPLPELEGATSILLEPEHVRKLTKQLPARTEGYSWKNIYSTAEHGYSLRNLYRSMNGIDSPVLIIIRDSSGMIFGALSPCAVKVSEHYYGTGETFLFNFIDWELNVYRWTGENNFFIKGNYNSLTLGGGDGAFGLWLDGDLYRGRSRSCKTFSNPCLAHDEDFIIADLEAWGFGLA
ncbi:nuclear receptor coactivator 7-like isoform X2 [Patiria miniata]|uniref:Oxidation resistance protein 1 n=1 Tax=Patiria miniata TaxID=46514 RepID=A0A913ZJZ6_PATMI|nr:nuclear receptor coactivator 7-like isoform X2 [Patiria miniata]XP_038051361.1 nuclear receptor coactivator 7-like isoform X2 [Patiria miniata]